MGNLDSLTPMPSVVLLYHGHHYHNHLIMRDQPALIGDAIPSVVTVIIIIIIKIIIIMMRDEPALIGDVIPSVGKNGCKGELMKSRTFTSVFHLLFSSFCLKIMRKAAAFLIIFKKNPERTEERKTIETKQTSGQFQNYYDVLLEKRWPVPILKQPGQDPSVCAHGWSTVSPPSPAWLWWW